jgi:L-ascorbate metabolism protein UlaG (beta-lactamase superfamily)
MIRPVLQDEAWLADVRRRRDQGGGGEGFRLWWLGQSGFLLQWRERHILIDPYLSDSLTKKYAATDKPHVRMTERVVAPERLDFIDLATSSHNHTAHLDAETLLPLRRANPGLRFVIPEANRAFVAERLQCDPAWPIGLDDGASTEALPGVRIHGIASAHEKVDRDAAGRCLYLGYVFEFGGFRVYHSGDCVLYDGMVEKLRPFEVDVALLPVNGTRPERRVAGNFDGREAARLAHDMGARCAIPCHYEMFEFNTASPDEFGDECTRLGQNYGILRAGECWTRLDQ